ncbi:MAG: hypothetical protein CXX67_07685 [Thaumarchaeota archaeon]|nr:MAG: hypothetical protein CXX67_07685 [Nitrososphaerota archaeon]
MYECGLNDRQELETIQNLILDRLRYLRERGDDLSTDDVLSDYYSLNDEILNCILNDHTFSPIIFGIIAVIAAFVAFRLWKLKKKKFKRF